MNDEQWLEGLRNAAREEAAMPLPEEVSRPLGEDFQARVLARIQAESGTSAAGAASAAGDRKSNVVRLWKRAAPAVAALALAAAVVLFLHGGRPHGDGTGELPDYVVALGGADQEVRGAPSEKRRFRRESTFTMTLQPARKAGAVDVRFARVVQGRVEPIDVPYRVSGAGALLVEARAEEVLGTTEGPVDIVVVLAPQGQMPQGWLDRASGGAPRMDGGANVRVERLSVELVLD